MVPLGSNGLMSVLLGFMHAYDTGDDILDRP